MLNGRGASLPRRPSPSTLHSKPPLLIICFRLDGHRLRLPLWLLSLPRRRSFWHPRTKHQLGMHDTVSRYKRKCIQPVLRHDLRPSFYCKRWRREGVYRRISLLQKRICCHCRGVSSWSRRQFVEYPLCIPFATRGEAQGSRGEKRVDLTIPVCLCFKLPVGVIWVRIRKGQPQHWRWICDILRDRHRKTAWVSNVLCIYRWTSNFNIIFIGRQIKWASKLPWHVETSS